MSHSHRTIQSIKLLATIVLLASSLLHAQSIGPHFSSPGSIALDADGLVYTWGDGWYGQLGDGTSEGSAGSTSPVKVLKGAYSGTSYLGDTPGNKVTAVAMGYHFALALVEDGTVYAWGDNQSGQLGDGTTTNRSTPVKVLDGEYSGTSYLGDNSGNKIIAIAAGRYHSLALASDGSVYAWGYNLYGALGDGTSTDRHTPVQVLEGEYSGTTYLGDDTNNKMTTIGAGGYDSFALGSDGLVYSWGRNYYGQLGNGSTTDSNSPVKVLRGVYSGTTYLGDDTDNKITAIFPGFRHTAAQSADGTVFIWGDSDWGKLGDNNAVTDRTTPVRPVMGAYSGTTYLGDDPGNKIIHISLGDAHSGAVAEDGMVYMWGKNSQYRLGDNTTTQRNAPIKALKGSYSGTTYLGDDSANKITQLALGNAHSLARTANNAVYAWGYNSEGELGVGTSTSFYGTAVRVSGVGGNGDLSLPVNLSAFMGVSEDGSIKLNWTTSSEFENLGFILERQIENEIELSGKWHLIADHLTHPSLEGQGSTNRESSYSYSDHTVDQGTTYCYRLSDVDYRGKITILGTVKVSSEIKSWHTTPESFKLISVYPNPFNPSVHLNYSLQTDAVINISVFDLKGQKIRDLRSGYQLAGYHDEIWDGLNSSGVQVAGGIYIMNINGNGFARSVKIVKLQ